MTRNETADEEKALEDGLTADDLRYIMNTLTGNNLFLPKRRTRIRKLGTGG